MAGREQQWYWWALTLAPLFVVVQLLCALVWISKDSATWPDAIRDFRWWATQFTVLGSTQFGRILPPAWSLDVESQFYLVAPWVAMLIGWLAMTTRSRSDVESSVPAAGRPSPLLVLVISALFGWSAWALLGGVSMEELRLDVYAWLFLTGMLCEFTGWVPSPKLATLSVGLCGTDRGRTAMADDSVGDLGQWLKWAR